MGRDKGKFNKRGGRGGSSRFQATSAEEIELRNARIAEFDEARSKRRADEDEDGLEEGGDEADEIQEGVEGIKLNGNEEVGANDFEGDDNAVEPQMTRKQREEAEKARKAAEYRKRHEQGLTEEYKRDMEKLAEVKRFWANLRTPHVTGASV